MVDCNRFTLQNGLQVIHNYNPQTAMAALTVLYNVGSRDEDENRTGMAHLFEHLMFGGSVNVANFDTVLEMAGGSNNAATSNDFTYFYDILPSQNIETAFYLESDRMLGLAFSDKALEVQRNVVTEEFKQVCLNRPYGTLMHNMAPMLYANHPYSWPVIGKKIEHITKVEQDDVRKWFYSHYAPNNAIMAITGNITLEKAKELAEKWMGDIPCREIPERHLPVTPWPTGEPQVKVVYDNVPNPLVAIGFRMDAHGEAGYYAADAITDILSAGKSARFYQRLVMGTDIFVTADAFISGLQHSGSLMLYSTLKENTDEAIEEAQRLLMEEVRQLAQPGNVSEYELERSKNRFESNFTFENMNLVQLSLSLCQCVYNKEDINQIVPRYRSIGLQEIASTAQRIFIDHSPVIVIYRPKN